MKLVRNYPVCDGCIHSELFKCKKFNEKCPSFMFGEKRYQTACLSCLNDDSYEFGLKTEEENGSNIAYFHMPGPENFDMIFSLLKFQQYYPQACYPNRQVSEIYGAWPGAIWNGRTTDYGFPTATIQEIDLFRKKIEALGITMNLTWNNHLVKGTDVYDRFCNNITEIFHNGKHSITVGSPELFAYLKEKFPNFKYYQSVIVSSNDKEFKYDDSYDMQLMVRNLNNNWDELLKIPEDQRNRIEFLCNDICTPICNRMGHYNVVNACLLNRSDETCLGNYCTIDHDFSQYNLRTWPITINPEDIDDYVKHKFIHFKLCGRYENDPSLALKFSRYFAKPEFADDLFFWLLSKTTMTEQMRKEKIAADLAEARKVIAANELE